MVSLTHLIENLLALGALLSGWFIYLTAEMNIVVCLVNSFLEYCSVFVEL